MSYIYKFEDLNPEKLYFIPMGGSEQFGINCNIYTYNGQYLMVDCGLGFADERLPGVDLILPDLCAMDDVMDNLAGLVITHAHEDHIGAVPYLWPDLKCPIYCTRFTAEVLKGKFQDHKQCKNAIINTIETDQEFTIADFSIQAFAMSHSIPQAISLLIKAGGISLFHSGDWNLDERPVLGSVTDIQGIARAGKQGVDVYVGDSTNALSPGFAGSESDVEKGLEKVIAAQTGCVGITLFSSNISRVQSIARAAEKNGRNVAVIGRSLHRMIAAAKKCGYLDDIAEFVPEKDLGLIPRDQLVVIMTGSQGEARAVMARVARGDFNGVYFEHGDTVIFSSREIPGNEKSINLVKNRLKEKGVTTIDPDGAEDKIHVSGHPYREEIKHMLKAVNPTTVIPVHGEYMQVAGQADLAQECGFKNTVIPKNGAVIVIDKDKVDICGDIPTGVLAVEPKRIISADHRALSERRKLQYTGAIHASVVVDNSGNIIAKPQLTTIGLFDDDIDIERQFLLDVSEEIYEIYADFTLEEKMDNVFFQEQLRIGLRRFISHLLGLKPKVTIHLVQI